MKIKTTCTAFTAMIFLSLFCAISTHSVLFAATATSQIQEISSTKELMRAELERIQELVRTKDLDGIEQIAKRIQTQWVNRPGWDYLNLMSRICASLTSADYRSNRQYELARIYASLALEKSNEMPIEAEARFVRFLLPDVLIPKLHSSDVELKNIRRETVKLWFHAWHRIETSIDRNFDFKDLGVSTVAPPIETGRPAGVAPEAIKDDKLRAQYEEAILKNNKKIEKYREQRDLHDLDKSFPKLAEQYVILTYSNPPANTEELKSFLETYKIDKATKTRILNAVAKVAK